MAWLWYALTGAFFAALVNVLCKRALKECDFTAAMALQGLLLWLTLLAAMLVAKKWECYTTAPKWALGLLAVAGVAAGLSWLAGYRALQLADVARTQPIINLSLPFAVILAIVFLQERPSLMNYVGIGLMAIGAFLVARPAGH